MNKSVALHTVLVGLLVFHACSWLRGQEQLKIEMDGRITTPAPCDHPFAVTAGKIVSTGTMPLVGEWSQQVATLTITNQVPGPGREFFLRIRDNAASGTTFGWDLFITDNVEIVEISTDAVRIVGKKGRICDVFGHNWRSGRPGEGNGFMYTDYFPNTTFRTCDVCWTCQSQTLEWK